MRLKVPLKWRTLWHPCGVTEDSFHFLLHLKHTPTAHGWGGSATDAGTSGTIRKVLFCHCKYPHLPTPEDSLSFSVLCRSSCGGKGKPASPNALDKLWEAQSLNQHCTQPRVPGAQGLMGGLEVTKPGSSPPSGIKGKP